MGIIITKMSLDGFDIPVPDSLSKLLSRSGAWKIKDNQIDNDNSIPDDYNRKVVKDEKGIRTYLTFKNSTANVKKDVS